MDAVYGIEPEVALYDVPIGKVMIYLRAWARHGGLRL